MARLHRRRARVETLGLSPDGRVVRYRVQATRVARTLITCYPFDAVRPGTPLRWVVIAQKVA